MPKYQNIVGTGFPDFIQKQINVRSNIIGSNGIGSAWLTLTVFSEEAIFFPLILNLAFYLQFSHH